MGRRSSPNPAPAKNPQPLNRDEEHLPGLYIHVPFCTQKCAYCSFYSVTDLSLVPAYVAACRLEMALFREWAPSFDTLYIGGGTPSVLPARDLETLIATAFATFRLSENTEITLEANPGDITEKLVGTLIRAGVNRLNIGVQSFSDKILSFLGRRHDRDQAVASIIKARAAGMENIGIDLIFGVPGQHPQDWIATLSEAVTLNPDHISCYQLTPEAGTPLMERYHMGEFHFPSEKRQADFFYNTSNFLYHHGYIHYEVSNFSKPGRESKHNQKYWNHTPYLGLGTAAHSFTGCMRSWNLREIKGYIETLASGKPPANSNEILDDEQLRLEALFLGLRTSRGICLEEFRLRYGQDLLKKKRVELDRYFGAGLLELRDGFLAPTTAGMAVADSLALL